MLKYCSIFLSLFFIAIEVNAQNFQNPDLEGTIINTSSLPPNWTNVPATDPDCLATIVNNQDTPDLVNQTQPDIVQGIIGSPYSGGTFVSGLLARVGINWPTPQYYHEGIAQIVPGFIIGQNYTVGFYQSVVQQFNCRDKSGSWSVYANNTLIGTTSPTMTSEVFNSTNLNWEYREFTFTVSSNAIEFKFLPADDDPNLNSTATDYDECLRMGIDNINIIPCTPPEFSFGNDTLICINETLILSAEVSNVTYLWQDNSSSQNYEVTQPGQYSLEVSNNCGSYTDMITVDYYNCAPEINLPNVFTPNGDNVNDNFEIISINNIKELKIIVLNRWGQTVFQSDKLDFKWSGKSNKPLSEGVYFWRIEYIDFSDEKNTLSGTVSLCY